MNNLKTLKDIEYGYVETDWVSGACIGGFNGVNEDELKQEVIKRWNFYKEKYMSEKSERQRIHLWGRMEEIKEFFNIIDEELKQAEKK